METMTRGRAEALKDALPWLGLLVAGVAFAADLTLPLRVAVGACYVLSVLTTFARPKTDVTVGMAVLVTVLIVGAMAAHADSRYPLWVSAVSRGVTLATVWASALLSLGFSRLNVRFHAMERNAQTRQAWLAQTLASIGDGVIACDASGHIEFMNAVAERLTGWRQDEAVDRAIDDVFDIRDEASGDKIASPVRRALQEGTITALTAHSTLRCRDNQSWPIDDSAAPIKNEKGEITGAVMVFREVSERRRGELQMALRLHEAGHRIRNVFANVQAILALCSRSADSPADLVKCVESRMASLMRSTDRLIQASDDGSSLREIVIGEVEPYLGYERDRLHFSGGDVRLSPEATVSFGMIIHELATNASKYGSLSTPAGRVEVRCESDSDDTIVVKWTERDGPAVTAPERKGMGNRLIEGLVKTQFAGKWEPSYTPQGFACRMRLNVGCIKH